MSLRPRSTRPSFVVAGLSTLLLSLGCGDSPVPEPTTGSLNITTATTGADLDGNGYMVAVDGGTAQAIGVDATVTIASLATGSHTVTLSGLADNCTVGGSNPRSVNVAAGATATASFAIACTSLTGLLQVSASVSGADYPASFDVTVDGSLQTPVATGGNFTYGPFDVGDHTVELGVPGNCTVATNPRTVTIPSGAAQQTAQTTFAVTCTSTQGYIEVTATVSGADSPTSFDITIDGSPQTPVPAGGNFTYGLFPIGDHAVELGLPDNCTVGSNPRTVTIPSGATQQTAQTTFAVTCP